MSDQVGNQNVGFLMTRLKFVCMDVAMRDQVHDMETIFHLHYIAVFAGITHIQQRFPDAVHSEYRPIIVSTLCTGLYIATNHQTHFKWS